MDMNIHGVKAVSVFRDNGYMKISILYEGGGLPHEINLYGAGQKTPLLRDSDDRIPLTPVEFGTVK